MIHANLKYAKNYNFLPAIIKKALIYAHTNDLLSMEPGSYEIAGQDLYVNIAEYTTCFREERFWEAHKEYIDIHLMLRGEECIDVKSIDDVKPGIYEADKDFLPVEASGGSHLVIREGDFLICYPEEAHQTGVMIDKPCDLKKAIFKIRLSRL